MRGWSGLGKGMQRDAFQRTVLRQSEKPWGSGGGRSLEPRRMTSRSGLGGRMRGSEGCAHFGVMEHSCNRIQEALENMAWKRVQCWWCFERERSMREAVRHFTESSDIWKSHKEPWAEV